MFKVTRSFLFLLRLLSGLKPKHPADAPILDASGPRPRAAHVLSLPPVLTNLITGSPALVFNINDYLGRVSRYY